MTFYEKFSHNIYSTNGEDGLLQEILTRLKIIKPFICELGNYRNTLALAKNGAPTLYVDYELNPELVEIRKTENLLNIALIKIPERFNLDDVIELTNYEKNFDILGLYGKFATNAWLKIQSYFPNIVIIESGSELEKLNFLIDMSVSKGYQFVQHTGQTMIFVRENLFPLLNIGYEKYEKNFII